MRKLTFCIAEHKGTDQIRSNCEADQRLCFCNTDSTIPRTFLIKTFKHLAIFYACTARFVTHLFGNHIVGFLIMWLISLKCSSKGKNNDGRNSVNSILFVADGFIDDYLVAMALRKFAQSKVTTNKNKNKQTNVALLLFKNKDSTH